MPEESGGSLSDSEGVPAYPDVARGWYYVGSRDALVTPKEVTLGSRAWVAFLADGRPHVLDGRCPHFGARLARGTVREGCLQCPLHGWRLAPDGRCVATPSGELPPAAARLRAYPAIDLAGHVFFHADPAHCEPFPFFVGVTPAQLASAPAFALDVEMPWWLVSANGFDVQHFLSAHDRRLVNSPDVLRDDTTFEARAAFDVVGTAWRDVVTRAFSGPRVEMCVRNAGGSLVLVTSRFRRSTTYGLVSIHPVSATSARVHTITWVRRGHPFAALDARIRASFIRAFLEPDIVAGAGIRYEPSRTIGADALLNRYLRWLSRAAAAID